MHISRSYRVSVVVTLVLIVVTAAIPSFVNAQRRSIRKKNHQKKSVYLPMETTVVADKFLKADVCKGRALVKAGDDLSKSQIEALKKDDRFFVEQISIPDIYRIRLLDKEKGTDYLFSLLTSIFYSTKPSAYRKKVILEPDYLIRGEVADNPRRLGMIADSWGLDKIMARRVWPIVANSEDSIVAVLDTGIYESHSSFTGDLWSSPRQLFEVSIAGFAKKCPRGTHGINFWPSNADEICQPADDVGHGTKVAGIIGAEGTSIGVVKNVKMLPIKIFDENEDGCLSDAIHAWDFIIEVNDTIYSSSSKKIIVVNNSFGFGSEAVVNIGVQIFANAIKRTRDNGLLLIASAGNYNKDISENGGIPYYPASFASGNIIAVAASDRNDMLVNGCGNGGSNYGRTTVHVSAPGTEILTTDYYGSFDSFECTSAAAPFVSGAAALLSTVCPNLTNREIKCALEQGADKNNAQLLTYVKDGRLDVVRAIIAANSLYGATKCPVIFSSPQPFPVQACP